MANITDVREVLITLLSDIKSGAIDLDKAKVMAEVSQVLINTVKAETDYLKVIGGKGSGFVPDAGTLISAPVEHNASPDEPSETGPVDAESEVDYAPVPQAKQNGLGSMLLGNRPANALDNLGLPVRKHVIPG